MWGKSLISTRDNKSKGPEAGVCLTLQAPSRMLGTCKPLQISEVIYRVDVKCMVLVI